MYIWYNIECYSTWLWDMWDGRGEKFSKENCGARLVSYDTRSYARAGVGVLAIIIALVEHVELSRHTFA